MIDRIFTTMVCLVWTAFIVGSDEIDPDTSGGIKHATVAVRSGYLYPRDLEPGWIIRKENDIGLVITTIDISDYKGCRFPLTVYLNPGTASEIPLKAELVTYHDGYRLLQVRSPYIPEPITLRDGPHVRKGETVYIFALERKPRELPFDVIPAAAMFEGIVSSATVIPDASQVTLTFDPEIRIGWSARLLCDSLGRFVGFTRESNQWEYSADFKERCFGSIGDIGFEQKDAGPTAIKGNAIVQIKDPFRTIQSVTLLVIYARQSDYNARSAGIRLKGSTNSFPLENTGQWALGPVTNPVIRKPLKDYDLYWQVKYVLEGGKVLYSWPVRGSCGIPSQYTSYLQKQKPASREVLPAGLQMSFACAPDPAPAIAAPSRDEVALPGRITDAVCGRSGQLLILKTADSDKLTFFDTRACTITEELALLSKNFLYCAGAEQVFVYYPDNRIVHAYLYGQFERKAAHVVDIKDRIVQLSMGNSAVSPVLVETKKPFGSDDWSAFRICNSDDFALVDLPFWGGLNSLEYSRDTVDIIPNATGNLFSLSNGANAATILIYPYSCIPQERFNQSGCVFPGPFGRYVYTYTGINTCSSQAVKTTQAFRIPARIGNFYGESPFSENQGTLLSSRLNIHYAEEHTTPLGTIELTEILRNYFKPPYATLPPGKRFFFLPEAGLLAVIPKSDDKIICYRFDIHALAAGSGRPYLYVSSIPPMLTRQGEKYEYGMTVRSTVKEPTFRLINAPFGMECTETGIIRWTVPMDFAAPFTRVKVQMEGAGLSTSHTYTLYVKDCKVTQPQ